MQRFQSRRSVRPAGRLAWQPVRVERREHLGAAAASGMPSVRRHPAHARRPASSSSQRHGAVALGEPRAVGPEHERDVRVARAPAARAARRGTAGAAWSRAGRRRGRPRRCPARRRRRRPRGCRRARRRCGARRSRRPRPRPRPVQPVGERDARGARRARAAPAGARRRACAGAPPRSAAGRCRGRRPRAAARAAPRRPRGSPPACRSTRRGARPRCSALDRGRVERRARCDWKTTSPSQSSPIARQVVELRARRRPAGRGPWSRSSIRTRKRAPAERANSQASSAVRRLPRCSVPVGLGAKRPSRAHSRSGTAAPSATSASRGRDAVALGVEELDVVRPLDADVRVVEADPRLGRRVVVVRCTCRRSRRSRRARRSRARSRPGCRAGGRARRRARTPSHSPNVGEPRRRSTTTSSTLPARARARACPGPGCVWKWIPRSVPRREREWLSWTNSVGTPAAAQASAR